MLTKLPIGLWVEWIVDWAQIYLAWLFDIITKIIEVLVSSIETVFLAVPPLIIIILMFILVWFVANRKIAIGTAIGLYLIYNMRLWESSIETLALVLASTALALLLGIPLGILSARSDLTHKLIMPLLDFMQTMPAFVYLIPAVLFFGLGQVPGLFATVVFAMPPTIRLTGLGIRQVPVELVEASDAFGATEWQKLTRVQIPLALPTIMAGINQCIMLSLSMVVIAAMIGAGGLGTEVLAGISRLDIAKGFEGGLAIVIMAVILDRVTQSLSEKRKIKI
ncbi:MAG: proline/glycine betaine ABC transporter permease [Desulfotomaculaceae bacterium]|nr:proline/glycine betaine ABC transporter permease [Desulfotomaculaceae bacterium]MDD4767004.1 proline/glycine betaine ABC transporter permease [Desulfotomaculaceae bacterium]